MTRSSYLKPNIHQQLTNDRQLCIAGTEAVMPRAHCGFSQRLLTWSFFLPELRWRPHSWSVTSAERTLAAVQSAVKHHQPLLSSPWASPPEVSTAMERPTPIFVGSMDAGWFVDMVAGRRWGKRDEGRRRSRTQLLFLYFLFLTGENEQRRQAL